MRDTHQMRELLSVIITDTLSGKISLDKARVTTNACSKQLTSLKLDIEHAKLCKRQPKILNTKF